MSKKNRNTTQINNVFRDIQTLNELELSDLYDITFQSNGIVFDHVENKQHNSLQEWAEEFAELNSFSPQYNDFKTSKFDWDSDY